jgi:regulator of sirC expression with transglutaminase-like and TPR domain
VLKNTTSLRLEPHDPEVYRARAKAYEKLDEKEKAVADRKRAKAMDKEE